MLTTHAVGIDLGTTFSCIAYLNERGEPVTLPNLEGEPCTPSVVMYQGGREIVGTQAWHSAITSPRNVVQNAKREIGNSGQQWTIEGRSVSPVDVSAAILRKLLTDASRQIGVIERAVITVPAQFSDLQRQATVQAGIQAGLKQVDIINEPIAAALCYVLGKEGLWFTELAEEQKILVYDLGGGTFDLSLVRYQQDEVKVIASSGDLQLGGIDFNNALLKAVADQFTREFSVDPRTSPESLQSLTVEVEQCKRSLSTRPRASLVCQHEGRRKTYQIEQSQFTQLTERLVKRTEDITRQMLKDNKLGWAHVNVVLTTGGSSRMPAVRAMLQTLSGRTLNTSLSPDQAIAHGAAYYAGMLLSNNEFARSILNEEAAARLSRVRQLSVNARDLGILVRDEATMTRVPHFMLPANTTLPASVTHTFGTVVPNQQRVVLRIVESGAGTSQPYVEIGDCEINGLPADLPVDSHVAVTISYDTSARIQVSARDVTSGLEARTQILREEGVVTRPEADDHDVVLEVVEERKNAQPVPPPQRAPVPPLMRPAPPLVPMPPPPPPPQPNLRKGSGQKAPAAGPQPRPVLPSPPRPAAGKSPVSARLEESAVPIPLCNECGEPLSPRGVCTQCGPGRSTTKRPVSRPEIPVRTGKSPGAPRSGILPPVSSRPPAVSKPVPPAPVSEPEPNLAQIFEPDDDDIFELPVKKPAKSQPAAGPKPVPRPAARPAPKPKPASGPKPRLDDDEQDFWKLPDE